MTSDTKTRDAARAPAIAPNAGPAPPPSGAGPIRFAPERAQDTAFVDALVDRAFGPGRLAKTAERLRENVGTHPDLSLCAWMDGRLAGAVRLWRATIGDHAAVFLGPIAVDSPFRHRGVGAELVEQACARARTLGEQVVVLVGDLAFFGPLGFESVPAGRVIMPGPVDPKRLLWTALAPGAMQSVSGVLSLRLPA